jgi:hypothetical protein
MCIVIPAPHFYSRIAAVSFLESRLLSPLPFLFIHLTGASAASALEHVITIHWERIVVPPFSPYG